jgi:hypothetical protein
VTLTWTIAGNSITASVTANGAEWVGLGWHAPNVTSGEMQGADFAIASMSSGQVLAFEKYCNYLSLSFFLARLLYQWVVNDYVANPDDPFSRPLLDTETSINHVTCVDNVQAYHVYRTLFWKGQRERKRKELVSLPFP